MNDGEIPRRSAEGYRAARGRPDDDRLKSAAESAVAGEKTADAEATAERWRARLEQEGANREAVVASAAAAGAAGSTLSGRPPAAPTPTPSSEPDRSSRVWILVAAAIGICFAAGLMLALRPSDDGDLHEQITADDAVKVRLTTTVAPTTEAPTTTSPATSAPTTAAPTTVAPAAAPPPAEPQQSSPAPDRPAPTPPPTQPAPAALSVIYPRDSQGNMRLLEGSTSAVVINNTGGQPGGYSVGASGAVDLGANNTGSVPPGGSVQVTVTAHTGVTTDPPHARLTVNAGAQTISIDVYIN